MNKTAMVSLAGAFALLAGCAGTGERAGGVQRLYVFNCGESKVADV